MDRDLGLFIVADGMGGHNAGEVASRIAVEGTAKSVREGLKAGKKAEQAVRDAIRNANQSIFEKSLNNPAWEEMGTTLVVGLTHDREVVIGHVGDSRAYSIRKGEIEQLTDDYTFVFEWLSALIYKFGDTRFWYVSTAPALHGVCGIRIRRRSSKTERLAACPL